MISLTDAEIEALLLSLRISGVSVVCALPFAILFSVFLAQARFTGRILIDVLVHLPLVLPPVVIGYLLLIGFGTHAPLGAWLLATFDIRLIFSWTGAALAAAIVGFPFQVRAIRLVLEQIDATLYHAAATLGAGAVERFFSLTLPLALPGILAGAITAFAASLGEFGAIITFVSNIPGQTRTLPLAIYTAIQTPGGGSCRGTPRRAFDRAWRFRAVVVGTCHAPCPVGARAQVSGQGHKNGMR